ncbi:hypothetical protein VE00_05695 [Pseudogymnoascus sp. WSF 3629]|nr:hypothetical protein VE00_05695 [Pseudogymnoascus sp. WSF 3629]
MSVFESKTVPDETLHEDAVVETISEDEKIAVTVAPKAQWWSYIWDYDPSRTKEERLFVQKLDLFLITMLSLGYFAKGLDQANIGTAFVSGMKEDLNMYGKQLNLVDTAWTIGYVVGMIPSQIILTKIRPSIWIPSCEVAWTLLTFVLAAATKAEHVIGIRFLIGLTESIFYPAAHLVLGSWYKPSELGKRAGIIYAVGSAAGMFSGYIQIAVYKNLNGTLGKAGWQWLFIMDGVISIPIAIAGFWLLPDYPHNTRAFYLNDKDRAMAQKRMADVGRAPKGTLGWNIVKRLFGRWHIYPLTLLYIVFSNNGSSNSVNPLTLWLKSEGWSVTKLNLLPSAQAAVQLVASIVFAIVSDFHRDRPSVMSGAVFAGLFSSIILAIWVVPAGLKWFALFLNRAAVPFGPLLLTWTNEICGGDAEERAITLGVMNAMGYAFNAWMPILTYPQTDAPRFSKGWIWSCVAFTLQFLLTYVVVWFVNRDTKKKEKEELPGSPA